MNLRKSRDRDRLLGRLSEGSMQVRVVAARSALPLISSTLLVIQSDKDAARARFEAIRDAAGEVDAKQPAINPVLQRKSNIYTFWAPIILLVEVALASFTASLTIAGGLILHLVAGFVATALFCGLAKIGISTMVDGERLNASVRKLEKYVQRLVIFAALLVGIFFVARFFPFAEFVFAVSSTLLSFIVAVLVALCLTLGELLGASNKELAKFIELSLLETEVLRLKDLAEELIGSSEASQPDRPAKAGLAAVSLLLLLSPARAAAEDGQTLNVWVDVSGSVLEAEWLRVREVLAHPLPFLEVAGAQHLTLTPFASEISALTGAGQRWALPAKTIPACTAAKATVFKATQQARDAECAAAKAAALQAWRAKVGGVLVEFNQVLGEIDVTSEQKQTCLYQVLDRIVATGASSSSLVITDGAHAACGPAPTEPTMGGSSSVVILMPDAGGDGVAARLRERTATLRHLYPDLLVTPSWKLTGMDAWLEVFIDVPPASVPPAKHGSACGESVIGLPSR